MTTVNLQNQLTNVSGDIQAYLCEPTIGCNWKKILARGDRIIMLKVFTGPLF